MNSELPGGPMSPSLRWGLIFSTSLVFGIGSEFWKTLLRILLQNRDSSAFNVLLLAVSLFVSVGVIIAYMCVMQRFATRDLRSKRSVGPPKGATWVEQIQSSSRLAWAMIGSAATTYLATLGGLTTAIICGKNYPRIAVEYRSFAIYLALLLWIVTFLSLAPRIFRVFARRWCRPQIPSTSQAGDRMLWDCDVDHEFASESRPVS